MKNIIFLLQIIKNNNDKVSESDVFLMRSLSWNTLCCREKFKQRLKSRLVSVVQNIEQGLLGSNVSHNLSPLPSTLQVVWKLVPVCISGRYLRLSACRLAITTYLMGLDKLIVGDFSPLSSVLAQGGYVLIYDITYIFSSQSFICQPLKGNLDGEFVFSISGQ